MVADKVLAHRIQLAHQSPYTSPETRQRLKIVTGLDVVQDVLRSMGTPV